MIGVNWDLVGLNEPNIVIEWHLKGLNQLNIVTWLGSSLPTTKGDFVDSISFDKPELSFNVIQ